MGSALNLEYVAWNKDQDPRTIALHMPVPRLPATGPALRQIVKLANGSTLLMHEYKSIFGTSGACLDREYCIRAVWANIHEPTGMLGITQVQSNRQGK